MKFKDLADFIDTAFPKCLSAAGDIDGIQICTNPNLEIGRILLTLDIGFDVIDYAVRHGYNCIISHHAMIYFPLKRLDFTTAASRKAILLVKNDICAVSIHTRLDSISGGVNDCLLDIIGVPRHKSEPFGNKDADSIGRIFDYSAETAKDFAVHIKNSLEEFYKNKFDNKFGDNIPVNVKYKQGDKPVRKVAAVCGSGMSFVDDALKLGVDTFFTGETKYTDMMGAYEFNTAGERINIIAAGHFETEAVVLPYLKKIISGEFPNIQIDIYASPFENIL